MASFCAGGASSVEYLTNFEFIKALTCSYADAMGFLAFALVVYGAIALSIYIRTDSITIPVVLLLVLGGAIMPQLAAPAAPLAVLGLLLAGAGGLTLLYVKYSR